MIDQIVSIINDVGFPIACVFAMFVMWNKEREAHKKESEKWVQALENNTKALTAIAVKIGEKEERENEN